MSEISLSHHSSLFCPPSSPLSQRETSRQLESFQLQGRLESIGESESVLMTLHHTRHSPVAISQYLMTPESSQLTLALTDYSYNNTTHYKTQEIYFLLETPGQQRI